MIKSSNKMTTKMIITAWYDFIESMSEEDFKIFPFFHLSTDIGEACCFACGEFYDDCQSFGGGKKEHIIKVWEHAPFQMYIFGDNHKDPLSYALFCPKCVKELEFCKEMINGKERFFGWCIARRNNGNGFK